jgi:hypothetical protein
MPDESVIGAVQYIDHAIDKIADTSRFDRFMHKPYWYSHEREIRVIFEQGPLKDMPLNSVMQIDLKSAGPTGVLVEVRLSDLIQAVHVPPGSPDWYLSVITKLLKRYGITLTPVRSQIDSKPQY